VPQGRSLAALLLLLASPFYFRAKRDLSNDTVARIARIAEVTDGERYIGPAHNIRGLGYVYYGVREPTMEVPVSSTAKPARYADALDSIRSVSIEHSSKNKRHTKEMLRYLVLVVALVAVIILISIALYYTQGNSVTIEHVRAFAPTRIFPV
jgi:hypothetical protein